MWLRMVLARPPIELERKTMGEALATLGDQRALWQTGLGMALNLGTAIALLIAGFVLAGIAARLVSRRLLALPKFDRTLVPFLANVVRYAILVLTGILVLSEFGVQTASIIAVLGAAGLAIGLALQGTLSNVASGLMLLILRPFQVGHYVEAGGTAGTVDEIGLFMTALRTPQNVRRYVPNATIFSGVITNYNACEEMRVDLEIGVAYSDDLAKAQRVMLDVLAAEARILETPAPSVITKALGDSAVVLEARAWVRQADFFMTRFDLTEAMKVALDGAEISIPFPHRQVIVSGAVPSEAAPRSRRKPATRAKSSGHTSRATEADDAEEKSKSKRA